MVPETRVLPSILSPIGFMPKYVWCPNPSVLLFLGRTLVLDSVLFFFSFGLVLDLVWFGLIVFMTMSFTGAFRFKILSTSFKYVSFCRLCQTLIVLVVNFVLKCSYFHSISRVYWLFTFIHVILILRLKHPNFPTLQHERERGEVEISTKEVSDGLLRIDRDIVTGNIIKII